MFFLKGKRILIVDDEAGILYLLEELLVSVGYETISAKTGIKAIQIAEAEELDLILLDFQLPVLNGLDVIQKLRELGKNIPIIMMTGMSEQIEMEIEKYEEIKSLLRKPFNISDVLSLVKENAKSNKIQAKI